MHRGKNCAWSLCSQKFGPSAPKSEVECACMSGTHIHTRAGGGLEIIASGTLGGNNCAFPHIPHTHARTPHTNNPTVGLTVECDSPRTPPSHTRTCYSGPEERNRSGGVEMVASHQTSRVRHRSSAQEDVQAGLRVSIVSPVEDTVTFASQQRARMRVRACRNFALTAVHRTIQVLPKVSAQAALHTFIGRFVSVTQRGPVGRRSEL